MAIDAVHGPHLPPWKCTSVCRLAFVAENLYLSTVEVGVTHPRNLLPTMIGGDVVDAHPGIDMPVDPLDQPERLLGRAYFQVQADAPRSVVLVGEVVGSLLEYLPVEFLWPVALFAYGPCRAEILDRCRDRPGIDVGSGGVDLVEPGKLGSDVPVGPGSDMAGGAGESGRGGSGYAPRTRVPSPNGKACRRTWSTRCNEMPRSCRQRRGGRRGRCRSRR